MLAKKFVGNNGKLMAGWIKEEVCLARVAPLLVQGGLVAGLRWRGRWMSDWLGVRWRILTFISMMRVGWMRVGSVSGDVKYLESWDACGHGL